MWNWVWGIIHIWWCACVPANVASPLLLVWCLVRGVLHTWCHGSNKHCAVCDMRCPYHEVAIGWPFHFRHVMTFRTTALVWHSAHPPWSTTRTSSRSYPTQTTDWQLETSVWSSVQVSRFVHTGEKVCSHWWHCLFYFALEVLATPGMFTSTFSYCYYCDGNWQLCVGPSLAVLLVLVVAPPTDFVLSNKIFYQTLARFPDNVCLHTASHVGCIAYICKQRTQIERGRGGKRL